MLHLHLIRPLLGFIREPAKMNELRSQVSWPSERAEICYVSYFAIDPGLSRSLSLTKGSNGVEGRSVVVFNLAETRSDHQGKGWMPHRFNNR